MLIRQEQRLKVLIVSWNEKWVSSEVYAFAPMNLAFCGYLLLLACSVRKRDIMGCDNKRSPVLVLQNCSALNVLQTVLKHAVPKLKHVTKCMLHTTDLCTGVLSCAFLLLIKKSVVFRFCAVSKFTLFTLRLLLVSFKKEKKSPQTFWKLI